MSVSCRGIFFLLVLMAGCSDDRESAPIQSASECSERGGKWRNACPGKPTRCFIPYADAGKTCSDSSECQGECIIDISIRCEAPGKCTEPPVPEPGTRMLGVCQDEVDECSSLVIVKDGVVQRAIHQD